MRKILEHCPSCGGELIVTRLNCTNCDTVITGSYRAAKFSRLSEEDLRFLEIFVSCRGNVKEMERETGLSYWTVRGKLDDIIEVLDLENGEPYAPREVVDTAEQRREILVALKNGDITPEEAEEQLSILKRMTGFRK
jgi:hypothetical protein